MLKFYNTLNRKKEIFKPLNNEIVNIYTCGPTVYNYAHIGNLSAYLFADLLKRYLKYSGYKINDVMNITDVDDKTIRFSKEKNKPLNEYTCFFTQEILKDFEKLNIIIPQKLPKATEHVKEMITLIQKLLNNGLAYQADDNSIYYRVSAFKDYGKFARLKRGELKNGGSGRINNDEYSKEEVADFVLWKAWTEKDGEIFWDSPFGKGRPGWHIECSAMSMKYLGETLDIHTGGIDLIFPHHQNEIAQSEGSTGKQFVRYWLHSGFLNINKEKMSKSLGNVYTLKEIMENVPNPLAFRYLILSNHYQQNLNFNFEALQSSSNALNKIHSFIKRISEKENSKNNLNEESVLVEKQISLSKEKFKDYMDDNLNTPKAIADLFIFINKINRLVDKDKIGPISARLILNFINDVDQIWGFLKPIKNKISQEMEEKINNLIERRNQYRKNREWNKADLVREELKKMGITIKDLEEKTVWETE